MSISLYNLTIAMIELMEDENATDEQIEAVFGEITAKDNRICHLRADLAGRIKIFKAEEERIATARKAMENTIDRLESYIKKSMELMEIDEITAGTFTLKLQNNPPSVSVDNESLIPPSFYTVIPQALQLDKKAIAAAIKTGHDVPGCSLKVGRSLRIK